MTRFARLHAVTAVIGTGMAFAVVAPVGVASTPGMNSGEQLAAVRRPAPVKPGAPPRTNPPKPVSLC